MDNSCDLFTAVNRLYGEDIDEESLLEEGGGKLEEVQISRFLLLGNFSSLKLLGFVFVLNYSGVVSYSSVVHENDHHHYQT